MAHRSDRGAIGNSRRTADPPPRYPWLATAYHRADAVPPGGLLDRVILVVQPRPVLYVGIEVVDQAAGPAVEGVGNIGVAELGPAEHGPRGGYVFEKSFEVPRPRTTATIATPVAQTAGVVSPKIEPPPGR